VVEAVAEPAVLLTATLWELVSESEALVTYRTLLTNWKL
jgi:hypothetical protein